MNNKSKKIAAACLALAMVASVGAANAAVFAADNGGASVEQSNQTPQEKLEALLDEIYALNPSDYTEESWNELKEQADSVNRPVTPYDEETGDGMPDWVANVMITNLTNLKDALVKNLTPQEKLEALLDEIYALNPSDYTEESWNELKEQADSVNRPVLPYDEETEEGMPDFVANLMITNLTNLKDALVPISSVKTVYEKLEDKLKEAEALNADDYTAESWADVQDIIDSVDRPVSSDNITEKLATKLLNDLEKAMNALVVKPDEGISLEDGTYMVNVQDSGYSSYLSPYIKIVAKDKKYSITLYTKATDDWDYEGGLKSNLQYQSRYKSEWIYPVLEVVNPEYSEEAQDNKMRYQFATKNVTDNFDVENNALTDMVKQGITSDNDEKFLDSKYSTLEDGTKAFTFETDDLNDQFYFNGIYGYVYHNYDKSTSDKQYPFYGSFKIPNNGIIKLPDDEKEINGTYAFDPSDKDLFRQYGVKVETKNGKIYATYNVDVAADINSNSHTQSEKFYDDNGKELDVSDGTVTLVYDSIDELIAGKELNVYSQAIDTFRGATIYHTTNRLTPDLSIKPVTLTDEATGIKLHTSTKYVSENAKLSVKLIKDTGSTDTKKDPWANAQTHLPKYNKEYFFSIEVTDNGKTVTDFNGGVSVEVPKVSGLNDSALRLFLNAYDNEYRDFAYGWFNDKIVAHDDYYSILLDQRYFDGNWCIYDEVLSSSDGSTLEDGTYEVPITTFNQDQPGQTSMSAKCFDGTAKLVVKDGVKRIELIFNPVDIGDMQGYLIQMWKQQTSGDWEEVKYTSYYKNEDGSYFTDDLNKGTNNFYPKTGYFVLPTDDPQFLTKFRVSAMDAVMGDNGDATREAIFTIYYDQAKKISDETPDPDPIEDPAFEPADMKALTDLVAKAEQYKEDDYTSSTYTTMRNALASAKTVLANSRATQEEVDSAAKELQTAIDALEEKKDVTFDINNLPDGKYQLYAQMIKTDRESFSMSNEGINHTVQLEVKDGEYYLTVQFKGLAIYNQFGYLQKLSYYDKGYTYNDYGIPQGKVIPAEVLTQYDIVDRYNDKDNLYPQLLKFKLVDKASEKYVPLQVFVPIMEAIADGTGTQDVLMQLDWTTLKATDADIVIEEPDAQSPVLDYTDSATGVKLHADKGVFAEGTTAVVKEITSGDDYDNAKKLISAEADKFHLYDVSFKGEDGKDAQPNGKFTISLPIPSDYANPVVYRIADGKKTLISGTKADGMFTFSAKEAGQYLIEDKKSAGSNSDNKTADSKTTNTAGSANPSTGAAAKTGLLAAIGAAFAVATKKRKER